MPASINPTNAIFSNIYLFGTKQSGSPDDVPFGEAQDFSFDDALEFKKLMGPSSTLAIGVGVASRAITATLKWVKIRARNFNLFRNAAVAFSTTTTVTANVIDEPTVFNLHMLTPANGIDAECVLYGCLCPNLSIPFATKDWVMPTASIEAFGDGTKVWKMTLPGDQSTS